MWYDKSISQLFLFNNKEQTISKLWKYLYLVGYILLPFIFIVKISFGINDYNPKIIILDEATASIDSESEQLIQKALDYLLNGRTSIIIAHRLSTIRKASQIMVLEKGVILERGNHATLLSQQGAYATLVQQKSLTNVL